MPEGMTYIVQRKDRFYVVAYDGLDPLTGKERRRWHPVGQTGTRRKNVGGRPVEFGVRTSTSRRTVDAQR